MRAGGREGGKVAAKQIPISDRSGNVGAVKSGPTAREYKYIKSGNHPKWAPRYGIRSGCRLFRAVVCRPSFVARQGSARFSRHASRKRKSAERRAGKRLTSTISVSRHVHVAPVTPRPLVFRKRGEFSVYRFEHRDVATILNRMKIGSRPTFRRSKSPSGGVYRREKSHFGFLTRLDRVPESPRKPQNDRERRGTTPQDSCRFTGRK